MMRNGEKIYKSL